MKKMFYTALILSFFASGVSFGIELSDNNNSQPYNINSGSQIGNTYYTQDDKSGSFKSYTRQGNDIYGSDGSHYYKMDNTIMDMNSGKYYQQSGDYIYRMHGQDD